MKALKITGGSRRSSYYIFPKEFDEDSLFEFLNKNPNKFIKLTKLSEKSCFPYFIKEDNKDVFVRLDLGVELEIVKVELLKRDEYTKRLIEVVKKACINCGSYSDCEEELGEIGNLRGHWAQINLDGYCQSFWRKKAETKE